MEMDTHSKNVCLIGILHITLYLALCLDPLDSAYHNVYYPVDNIIYSSGFQHITYRSYFLSMAFLAALMIYGVIKKRHILLAPFLAMSILYLCVVTFALLQNLCYSAGTDGFFSDSRGYKFGGTLMAIYPIKTLFMKLHSKNEASTPTKASLIV